MNLDKHTRSQYLLWTQDPAFDEATRKELLSIDDPAEIEDRFYKNLAFGTGGIRGPVGAGTNRMNRYLIRRVTRALADCIEEEGSQAMGRGVVIAYDARKDSAFFALETALVLAARGIVAYLFEGVRTTPQLSFTLRELKAVAGVNITASHNPKGDNGYKVYWQDGGQLPPGESQKILDHMASYETWATPIMDPEEAREKGLLKGVPSAAEEAYFAAVATQRLQPELGLASGKELKVVFTPLHGAAGASVRRLLLENGYHRLWLVPEQAEPDPGFSTLISPNPEDPTAFEMALALAEEKGADLVLATDPDGDRVGLFAKDKRGQYQRFTGNQIGLLLAHYILSQEKAQGILPQDGVLVKSIASTDLLDPMARAYGLELREVLVGFKYVAEQIKAMEEDHQGQFVFGFEESHGYLKGTYTRDKDGLLACLLLCEAGLNYLKTQGQTLPEVLEDIFRTYGTYLDEQVALTLARKAGQEIIDQMLARFRQNPPKKLDVWTVEVVEDYLEGVRTRVKDQEIEALHYPRENVLRFRLQGGGFVVMRPSGTEPKVRFYFCVKGQSRGEAQQGLERLKKAVFDPIGDLLE